MVWHIGGHRLLGGLRGLFAGHHVEEVGGVGEVHVGGDDVAAVDDVLHVADDGWDDAGEGDGLGELGLG